MSFKANEVPDDQADKLVDTLEEKVSMSSELFSGNMLRQRCGSELEVLGIDTNLYVSKKKLHHADQDIGMDVVEE
ncbi:hypothetical protein PG988_012399 [Apiospora saccharicola]